MLRQNHIMLLVTENCNLRCTYCYEHQKNSKVMSWNTAQNIIDRELSREDAEGDSVIIEVFGGEAFLNFNLIRQIDEYVCRNYPQIKVFYETTTNGTCVHGEIQNWLRQRKERFLISLSLDGTPKMHDQNRKYADGRGSFDKIDIDFFRKTWPGCPAKMTVSEKTLPDLAEGVMYLEGLGFQCDATFSVGVEWDYDRYKTILMEQLGYLAEYYSEHPEQKLCTMLNLDLRLIFTPMDEEYRFCGAGVDIICYDAEGERYPCQGFAPVSIGREAEKFRDYDQDNFRFTSENRCRDCRWVRLCSNCYAANFQATHNMQIVDEKMCGLYKLCILASARIQYNRLMMKTHFTEEDRMVLKAIHVIQEEL